MNRIVGLVLMFMLLGGCSNLSKNFSKKGEFNLRGGKFQNSEWKEILSFKRYSWYHEVTMLYDMMLSRLDSKSPFYDWLSNGEKKTINSCDDFYVMLDYSLDSKRVSKKMVENDVKRVGYEKIVLKGFESYLINYFDVEEFFF